MVCLAAVVSSGSQDAHSLQGSARFCWDLIQPLLSKKVPLLLTMLVLVLMCFVVLFFFRFSRSQEACYHNPYVSFQFKIMSQPYNVDENGDCRMYSETKAKMIRAGGERGDWAQRKCKLSY